MATVSLVIGLVSFRGIQNVETSYERLAETTMPNFNTLNDMILSYRSVRINLRTLGMPGLTKEQADQSISAANEAIASYEKFDKTYNEIPFQPGEQEIYDRVNESWLHFKEIGSRAISYYNAGTGQSRDRMMKIFLEECPNAAKEYTQAVTKLKEYHIARGKEHVLNARSNAHSTNQLVFFISLFGVVIGLVIGYFFSTFISNTISTVAQTLASNADQVTSASNQIASSSEELSQTATEQATSLEETAASLEEITSMINQTSGRVDATAASSQESHQQAEEGRAAVEQMLSSMNEISQSNEAILAQVNEGNRQMTEIGKVIREIGNKTKVINEIVFQTKLLSFNASVEAARAGEHGKGFAVVAEEVGNLAQMSGNAAKEISEMLDGSILKVEGIVEETKTKVESLVLKGKEKVDNGVVVAKQCSSVLDQIVDNVSKVSDLSRETSQANKEQAMGINEINKAMSQLDMSTQQNAAASEEAASAAEELSAQASSLKAVADELISVINGAGTATGTYRNYPDAKNIKPFSHVEKGSNIVHLKSKNKPFKKPTDNFSSGDFFKKAAGGDVIGRNDSGFNDV